MKSNIRSMDCWQTICLVSFAIVGVAIGAEYDVMWTVPQDGAEGLPDLTVMVGDTVNFVYGTDQPHNVWIHGNGLCEMDPDNRIQVVNQQGLTPDGLKGSYTFTEAKRLFFVCDYSNHCENGLNIYIQALANVDEFLAAGGDPSKVPAGEDSSSGSTSGGTSGDTNEGSSGASGSDGGGMGVAAFGALVLSMFGMAVN